MFPLILAKLVKLGVFVFARFFFQLRVSAQDLAPKNDFYKQLMLTSDISVLMPQQDELSICCNAQVIAFFSQTKGDMINFSY